MSHGKVIVLNASEICLFSLFLGGDKSFNWRVGNQKTCTYSKSYIAINHTVKYYRKSAMLFCKKIHVRILKAWFLCMYGAVFDASIAIFFYL